MKNLAVLLLLLAASCGATPEAQEKSRQEVAQAVKEAAPFLPAPFNYLVATVATALAAYGGHKTVRHLSKKSPPHSK